MFYIGLYREQHGKILSETTSSVSARSEFSGVIDDPLFENFGVIGKFRGSELFSSPELKAPR